MTIPLREYYTLPRAAELLGCNVDDLIHWAASGYIDLAIYRSSIIVEPCFPDVSYILNNDTYRKFITKETINKLDEILPFIEKNNEKHLLLAKLFLQDIETQKNNAFIYEEQELKISIACNALNLCLYGSIEDSLYKISLCSGGFDESMVIDIEDKDLKNFVIIIVYLITD